MKEVSVVDTGMIQPDGHNLERGTQLGISIQASSGAEVPSVRAVQSGFIYTFDFRQFNELDLLLPMQSPAWTCISVQEPLILVEMKGVIFAEPLRKISLNSL